MLSIALAAALAVANAQSSPGDATLDRAMGWISLSGPDATSRWRGYKQKAFPTKGWTIKDGVLEHSAGGGGGDLITTESFADFELELEFKTAPKANSGIMYRVAESQDATYMTGPEFQVLDDAGAGEKPESLHAAGAMYDLFAAPADKGLKASGEWNAARIRMRNGVVQHWLNGRKVVEARLFSENPSTPGTSPTPTPEWLARVAGSKFKAWPAFGLETSGAIALQDHGDHVSYRNVRARHLARAGRGDKALFDGRSLEGWVAIVPDAGLKEGAQDAATIGATWTVRDGVLVCLGKPQGYIRTREKFANFVLRLEWRFDPETKRAGNSGVLVRLIGEDKVWPKSVEAQLHSGNAGDFWNIDNFTMTTATERTRGRNTKKTHGAERPVGEWNDYEIIVHKGDVILKVNGEEVNRATGVEEAPGFIALQSEGAEIHFRDVRLTPLD